MNARTWLARALAGAAMAGIVLAGCGGGVGSGGTGMASGLTLGTVNGFGSVVVDGDRFDDREVASFVESAPGVNEQTDARLGMRLAIEADRGTARRVQVEPAVVGAVEALSNEGLQLLGQRVRVNADPALGPVTQFGGGYGGLASVAVGDAVEVHAFVRRTPSGFDLQATRVDRRAALPAFLRVSGLVSGAEASGFQLGALRVLTGGATILPAGAVLADGQAVSVLAPAQSLVANQGVSTQLLAAQVRIRGFGSAGDEVASSGIVGMLDPAAGRFELGSIVVDYREAAVRPSAGDLADGRYVQVRGAVTVQGTLRARSVRVLDGRSNVEAELKGTVSQVDATGLRFQVRGVDVDASGAEIEGCPGGVLADGLFVELEGRLAATGVIAKSVHCEGEPAGAIVEREGVAGSVDAVAQRFVLTRNDLSTLTVAWNEVTYFQGVNSVTLSGQRVEVEGQLVDGVLVAKKIQLKAADD